LYQQLFLLAVVSKIIKIKFDIHDFIFFLNKMTTSILDNTINQLPTVSFPNIGVTENSCAICLNDYSDGSILLKMPCDHHFHKNCASAWLHINTTCPICRHDLNVNYRAINDNYATIDPGDNVPPLEDMSHLATTNTDNTDNTNNTNIMPIINYNTEINNIINNLYNQITAEINNEINSLNSENNNTLTVSLINIRQRLQDSIINRIY